MDLIAAVVYVLAVYVGLPMYLFGTWDRGADADGRAVRARGAARIRRELERRRAGVVDGER